MMDTASTSETSVGFYQTTRGDNPEDSHRHNRCRENLKLHYFFIFFMPFSVFQASDCTVVYNCSTFMDKMPI
jgi:hypothetical protein